jgi:hypothetical protein
LFCTYRQKAPTSSNLDSAGQSLSSLSCQFSVSSTASRTSIRVICIQGFPLCMFPLWLNMIASHLSRVSFLYCLKYTNLCAGFLPLPHPPRKARYFKSSCFSGVSSPAITLTTPNTRKISVFLLTHSQTTPSLLSLPLPFFHLSHSLPFQSIHHIKQATSPILPLPTFVTSSM